MFSGSRRWVAFGVSVLLHCGVIAFITWMERILESELAAFPQQVAVTLPDPVVDPAHKIVWYNFGTNLPSISPAQQSDLNRPSGARKTPQILISRTEKKESAQVIEQIEHPKPLPTDVPAPNLVAVDTPAPKSAREFVLPAPQPIARKAPDLTTAAPIPIADAPAITAPLASLSAIKVPPKPFVAPKPSGRPATSTGVAPNLLTDAPDATANASDTGVQALLLGLAPVVGPPPDGSRAGRFSEAPNSGPPNAGASPPGSLTVAAIASSGGGGTTPKSLAPVPTARKPLPPRIVKEIVLPAVNRTMSVPLRPSSRVIPAPLEALFGKRNVYTLVIPAPDMSEYPGDWVLWFAERQMDGPSVGILRAPIPNRKYVRETPALAGTPVTSGTVRVSLAIDREGKVGNVQIIGGTVSDRFKIQAVEEMETWEFEPARRSAVSVDVDAVIELPMRLMLGGENGSQVSDSARTAKP